MEKGGVGLGVRSKTTFLKSTTAIEFAMMYTAALSAHKQLQRILLNHVTR